MSQRRMFSVKIINSARFLKMPIDAQNLYFHLGIRADDDGIVEAFTVMRLIGSTEDNLKVLHAKGFVRILNDDLVTYITDWLEHNQIRPDRKINSIYKDLLIQIIPDVQLLESRERADRKRDDNGTSQGQPEDSIGKVRLGEDKLNEESIYIIFSHWNSKKIIQHRTLTDKLSSHINARLKEGYEVSDIIAAIDNYCEVLNNDLYYWTYKWGLTDFLLRGFDKFKTESEPFKNFLKEQLRSPQPQRPSSNPFLDALKEMQDEQI